MTRQDVPVDLVIREIEDRLKTKRITRADLDDILTLVLPHYQRAELIDRATIVAALWLEITEVGSDRLRPDWAAHLRQETAGSLH